MPRTRRRRANRRSVTNPVGGKRTGGNEAVSIKHVNDLHTENQASNLTTEFDSNKHIVLRRGNSFEFIVKVSSLADVDKNKVTFELHRGHRARYTRGTMFQGACSIKSKRYYQWDMKVLNSGSDTIHYRLDIPVDAPVGAYTGYVRLPGGSRNIGPVWEMGKELVIVFNPWCKDDEVYIADDDKRQEYVLNETGLIWAGTYKRTFTWPWNYAQFETKSLEAVLYMMDMWNLGSDARRSPVTVSRCMAEMVNENDSDGGILVGLWSGNDKDYADGTDPTSWSGSEAILKEYMKTKKPVKYAQCWVFGGTLTTTLRTLGIPSRPITNFESAHDSEFNRAIDYYYDENDNMLKDLSGDSIWNYHVWCEAWMTRPDLEGNHGGWQALDATPQELSPHTRTMVVGPASTQAIKDGLDLKYDNEFVIAEVNADIKYHYRRKAGGDFAVMGSDITTVGKHISTKAVGSNKREDITLQYKYKEGSASERAALKGGKTSEKEDATKPFKFEADLTSSNIVGTDLTFTVTIGSTTSTKGNVNVSGIFEQVTYTGVIKKEIKKITKKFNGNVSSTNPHKMQFPLSFKDYEDYISGQATLLGTFLVHEENHDVSWLSRVPVNLALPTLTINVNGKGSTNVPLKALKMVHVTATFDNPLNTPLTDVHFFLEGAGLLAPTNFWTGPVFGKGKCSTKFEVTPRSFSSTSHRNNVTLIVTVESKQLKGIMGTATINIVK